MTEDTSDILPPTSGDATRSSQRYGNTAITPNMRGLSAAFSGGRKRESVTTSCRLAPANVYSKPSSLWRKSASKTPAPAEQVRKCERTKAQLGQAEHKKYQHITKSQPRAAHLIFQVTCDKTGWWHQKSYW